MTSNQKDYALSSESSAWTRMTRGAIAGVAARTASAPFDLLKIRLQLQPRLLASKQQKATVSDAVCTSRILNTARDVWRMEGPLAFWKGNVAGLYLYALYGAVQFGVYGAMQRDKRASPGVSGATAAMAATIVSYPFDVIRTRHSLRKSPPPTSGTTPSVSANYYRSVPQTIRAILRSEGAAGLYRGLLPSLAQVVPYMALAFSIYERTRKAMLSHRWSPSQSPLLADTVAGAVSGVISKTLMMPVDTVRKRLQIQGSPYRAYVLCNLPVYSGLLDCCAGILRGEGPRGFFNGLSLALLKSLPSTMTTFVVYGLLSRIGSSSQGKSM